MYKPQIQDAAPASPTKKGDQEDDTKGIAALAVSLRESASVQVVTLEGGALPVHILLGRQRIKTIDLSRQSVSFMSGILLGAFLSANPALTELNLHSNDFGPNGLRTIIEPMQALSALNTLGAHANSTIAMQLLSNSPCALFTLLVCFALPFHLGADLGNNIRPPGVKLNLEKGAPKGGAKGTTEEPLTAKQLSDYGLLLTSWASSSLEKLHFDNNALSELQHRTLMSLKVLSLVGNRLEACGGHCYSLRSAPVPAWQSAQGTPLVHWHAWHAPGAGSSKSVDVPAKLHRSVPPEVPRRCRQFMTRLEIHLQRWQQVQDPAEAAAVVGEAGSTDPALLPGARTLQRDDPLLAAWSSLATAIRQTSPGRPARWCCCHLEGHARSTRHLLAASGRRCQHCSHVRNGTAGQPR